MDYHYERTIINKIFDKNHEFVSITDIQNFFLEKQEETSILEFKSGDLEIIDLYKEIAAFLNTEGLIILGAPREQKETVGKVIKRYCQGSLTYSSFRGKIGCFKRYMQTSFLHQ